MRLFPIVGALTVVLVWYGGDDGLARADGLFRLFSVMGPLMNQADFSHVLSITVLIVGIAGMGMVVTSLRCRQHRLETLLRGREYELGAGHPHHRAVDLSGLDDDDRFRLAQAINGVRRLNSAMSGRVVPTSPLQAIGSARHRLSDVMGEADVALIIDPLPDIIAEPEALTEIFSRLIGNAVRFRVPSRRPVVHISALRDGAMIAFRIRDNGLGIEPARAARLFEIFRQSGVSGETIGAGLSAVRRLVEGMGGKIWVDLVPGQEGTTFGFTLPAATHPSRRRNDIKPM
ncbi:Putative two-component sensor protein, classical system [Magnetospirillum molischianum DSM 120]|uniref:histidine kinase n=1 Tax=Magnetospirillum molischianum DSM 120 TaxID=1150626 RepID=H8FV88_MAGML|nr:Putative two-component sensor protein, classical system [Magnetospirillum molischianum DSM 120]